MVYTNVMIGGGALLPVEFFRYRHHLKPIHIARSAQNLKLLNCSSYDYVKFPLGNRCFLN